MWPDCSNINRKELLEMAGDTLGFSAIGGQTELSSMFQAIMDGLRAQLVAHANVFAGQGLGQAVLTVKLRDGGEFVTQPFGFMSDQGLQCAAAAGGRASRSCFINPG